MGRSRRCITPGEDAAVWCPDGRFGPKRIRVEQCRALRAEDVYTGLLRENAARTKPGAYGWLMWTVEDSSGRSVPLSADWELRPNAVWQHGRLFFHCPRCARRATRLYVPRAGAGAGCRQCWGLTYESRQRRSYRPSRSRYGPIFSPRMYALIRADDARQARAAAAEKRYAERREILKQGGQQASIQWPECRRHAIPEESAPDPPLFSDELKATGRQPPKDRASQGLYSCDESAQLSGRSCA